MSFKLNLYFNTIYIPVVVLYDKKPLFSIILSLSIYFILSKVSSFNLQGGKKMSKQQQHWEKTRGLLFVTLAIWFVFSIGIFLFGAEMQESSIRPFGYPLTYWFTCQGSLAIFVILIFWFAGRQEKIDDEFGLSLIHI